METIVVERHKTGMESNIQGNIRYVSAMVRIIGNKGNTYIGNGNT